MCQGGGVEQPAGEASMGQASTMGLDIAKWVFQAHGADAIGRVVFRKRLVRAKVLEVFAGQPPWPGCLNQWKRRTHPYLVLGSCDADGLRASQLQHAVEDVDGNLHLGRPTLIRA